MPSTQLWSSSLSRCAAINSSSQAVVRMPRLVKQNYGVKLVIREIRLNAQEVSSKESAW